MDQREPSPFTRLMGVKIISRTAERTESELLIREDLCNRHGVMHGGAVMAWGDTLGGMTAVAALTDSQRTATIESDGNLWGDPDREGRCCNRATKLRGHNARVEHLIRIEAGQRVVQDRRSFAKCHLDRAEDGRQSFCGCFRQPPDLDTSARGDFHDAIPAPARGRAQRPECIARNCCTCRRDARQQAIAGHHRM